MSTLLAAYAATSLFIHAISCATATAPTPKASRRRLEHLPPVSVLRPISGLHAEISDTLASSFTLTGTKFEVIFCAPSEDDPAVPLVRELMRAHPHCDAQLLIGLTAESFNPKLDNLQKGWRAAKYRHVMMADSNVYLPSSALTDGLNLLAEEDVGLVTSPPLAIHPEGFAAELETAFLNGHQLRWQLMLDAFGNGFAQGKLLFLQKETLGAEGLNALTRDYAEDAASTKHMRDLNLRVKLLRPSLAQPVGKRSLRAVWARQERWAQLRWNSFPLHYLPEILSGGFLPIAIAFVSFGKEGFLYLLAWYALESLMLRANGWHLSLAQIPAMLLRDITLPALWLSGLVKRHYEWNGHRITLQRQGPRAEPRKRRIAKG